MTIKQFDDYKFSINTEVMFNGIWEKVIEVDFEAKWVRVQTRQSFKYHEIENIRQAVKDDRENKE